MKFLSFLFGGRKKEAPIYTEPSVAPVSVTIPSPALPQAEPTPPSASRVEPAPARTEPLPSPSRTAIRPTPSERVAATLPQDRARVQWRGYPIGVVGEVHNQEALIALCGPYTSQVGVGDTFGYGQKFDAVIELEPTNSQDPNAVVVKIKGHRVGYLPRDQAARVGQQMRDEGLDTAICDAIVDGGWRVNQHESGLRPYEVRVGIPDKGWIDFGIGSLPPLQPGTNRPISSGKGPLRKEWIALLGIEADSDTARQLAKNGARIMVGPGVSTTFLVVAENQPFSDETKRSKTYRKAEDLIAKGARLRIVSLDEMQAMIATGSVGVGWTRNAHRG